MAKKTKSAPEALVLFPIEGHVANRTVVRDVSQNSDHLRKVDLGIIKIRPFFNPRSRNRPPDMIEELWERAIMVPDLADKIFASNGPAHSIIGDIHEDGNFYITDGERRFRALRHLINTGRDTFPNGKSVTVVYVILNPPGTTDAERKKKAVAANDNLALTPMQLAFHYLSFKEEEKWSHEQIAEECNVSRQTIDNYIIAATHFDKATQEAIDLGEVKMTNAILEWRKKKGEAKPKKEGADEESIITGKKAEDLEKKEKEKQKARGDEDEFEQQDNSIPGVNTKSGPKEDTSSGAHVVGTDSIYMRQQKEAIFKRFFARYNVLYENARKLVVADKPEDETDEERAPILHDKRHDHAMNNLMKEYDITIR